VTEQPPDDQPDEIWIGPVGPIPVHYVDDPRLERDRAAWRNAAAVADGLVTADELLSGLGNGDWRVRLWVIDRIVARASSDERVVPELIEHLKEDPAWQVRDRIAGALAEFPAEQRVIEALVIAEADEHDEVRQSSAYALEQIRGA